MARLPLTIDDPQYHSLLETLAFDIGGGLADALLDAKVPKETAHELVTLHLFDIAMRIDMGGRYRTAGKYRPQVAFDNGLGQVIVPTKGTYLHERVHEIVERIFNIEGRR